MNIKEQINAMTPEKREFIEDTSAAVGAVALTMTSFVKALRAAKAGNYTKAIFYAVLWMGFSQNYDNSLRQRQEARKRANRGVVVNVNGETCLSKVEEAVVRAMDKQMGNAK